MLMSAQSQKAIDDGRQHNRVSLKPNETARANDTSLFAYSATTAAVDDRAISPSLGRLRTSPRGEVSSCIF